MKLLCLSCVSATFELDNKDIYYSKEKYDVFLDDKKVLSDVKTNVFSLYNLSPNTNYVVQVNNRVFSFLTPKVSEIISSSGIDNTGESNVTKDLQALIDNCKENGLVVIEPGKYFITSLKLKSNMTLYLKEGAILSASIVEEDYEELKGEYVLENGDIKQVGTWEGSPFNLKYSIINGLDVENVKVVGQGIVDGNAQLSTWWQTFKQKPYARPHLVFFNHSKNITIQGVHLMNSPQWTVHPYFCENVNCIDFKITNPKISPNTDGINPQCCNGVKIIGVHFSVGDDCIALKSGKMYIGQKYKKPCENIIIRNCLMQFGHGAIVLGSEMSGGIKNLTVERCYFDHTDRGLRIKTRRGRGNTAIIDNVEFNNIYMDNVLTPLVINMFYFCDPDGKTEYVYSKEKWPVDERTPYLGKFTFNNIIAENSEVCAGYFYGLPEMFIKEININDSVFTFKEDAKPDKPAMMSFIEDHVKSGFVFNNVETVNLKNVVVKGQIGKEFNSDGNGIVNYE